MAKWRAKAIELLPECRACIAEAPNLMSLWIDLWMHFDRAYQPVANYPLIERIYAYADWCEQAPRNESAELDPPTCVCVAFYEHIPTNELARNDMPRWFTPRQVAKSEKVFSYLIGKDQFACLLKYVEKNKHLYRQPPERARRERGWQT